MTAAEMVAMDFYDALKDDNLQGLCITLDADGVPYMHGVYTNLDEAAFLTVLMLEEVSKKYNFQREAGLMSTFFYGVKALGYFKRGGLNHDRKLDGAQRKELIAALKKEG